MIVKCDWCGADVLRYPSELKISKHTFCCPKCRSSFLSKKTNPKGYIRHEHLSDYNREHNIVRMSQEVRHKLRDKRLNTGEGKTYSKLYGRHTHRVVAEMILGRKLEKGEVVHHIDGNKRNNSPENLRVFKSQSEHAAWHMAEKKRR